MVHLDDASQSKSNPQLADFQRWGTALSSYLSGDSSLCLKLVTVEEMTTLNQRFRGKNGATNVLSFPADLPDDLPSEAQHNDEAEHVEEFLGDIAICSKIVSKESEEQRKGLDAHWAHLFLHGVLHLLGYDHQDSVAAEQMEQLETELLATLMFPPPYQEYTA
ncbi:MAG: rRNA maturation RNase YbeY [Pseudomonadales bacterium]